MPPRAGTCPEAACLAFPSANAPGLRGQLIRAALSTTTNIAEGATRPTRLDFARFLSIATASAAEVEHHLNVAGDFGLLDEAALERLLGAGDEVRRMLFGLRRVILANAAGEVARRKRPQA